MIYQDGSYYTGLFQHDRKHGPGMLVRPVKNKQDPNFGKLLVEEGEGNNDKLTKLEASSYIEPSAERKDLLASPEMSTPVKKRKVNF